MEFENTELKSETAFFSGWVRFENFLGPTYEDNHVAFGGTAPTYFFLNLATFWASFELFWALWGYFFYPLGLFWGSGQVFEPNHFLDESFFQAQSL